MIAQTIHQRAIHAVFNYFKMLRRDAGINRNISSAAGYLPTTWM
jgi:hypothetical protein